MMRRLAITFVGVTALICNTLPALAQSATTGAINGRVRDASGADLPGVTVTITSPNLIAAQTAVTTAEAGYRFPNVPPGAYRITYELAGFSTLVREGVQVTGNFTATVNVEMGLSSLNETVTVSGESPIIDVQATKVQTTFTTDQLETLPGARDIYAVLSATPGVRMANIQVGSAQVGNQTGYQAYGGGPNRPVLEGLVMANGGAGNLFMFYDYGSFENIVVNAAGQGADVGAPGVNLQMIVKSGGNQFRGSVLGEYQGESFQGRNIDADQIAQGIRVDSNRVDAYNTFRADAGGPIRRDRIWFYGAYNRQRADTFQPNFPAGVASFATLWNLTGKATMQLSASDKLVVFYSGGQKDTNGNAPATNIYLNESDIRAQKFFSHAWKGEWNRVVSEGVYFELIGGQGRYWNDFYTVTPLTVPAREDIITRVVTGPVTPNNNPGFAPTRNQVLSSVSLFKSGWGGSQSTHNIKIGGEFLDEKLEDGNPTNGHVVHRFSNGVPTEVLFHIGPTLSTSRDTVAAVYVNDNWNVNSRLSVSFGGRYDYYRAWLPEQGRDASQFSPVALHYNEVSKAVEWNMFSPRVGVAYNLRGDGRTVAKVNTSRYWWTPGTDLPRAINGNQGLPNQRFSWRDNGDGLWQRGEEGALLAQTGGAALQLDPDLENTYSDEVNTSIEQQVGAFGLRAGFVWRGHRQQYGTLNVARPYDAFTVPVQVRDPGPDGRAGTADDGAMMTLFNLNPARLGVVVNQTTNLGQEDDYYTIEFSAVRRRVGRFNIVADFARTWARTGAGSQSPNDRVNTADDGRHHTSTWQGKFTSTVDLPAAFRVTPLIRYQSGHNFGRTFVANLNYGTQTVRAEPEHTNRAPSVTDVDVRVARLFRLSERTRISAVVDFYNILNANPPNGTGMTSASISAASGTFLRPNTVLPPRSVRIGATFDW